MAILARNLLWPLFDEKMTKTYDRAYFDRWYRNGEIGGAARLARTTCRVSETHSETCRDHHGGRTCHAKS